VRKKKHKKASVGNANQRPKRLKRTVGLSETNARSNTADGRKTRQIKRKMGPDGTKALGNNNLRKQQFLKVHQRGNDAKKGTTENPAGGVLKRNLKKGQVVGGSLRGLALMGEAEKGNSKQRRGPSKITFTEKKHYEGSALVRTIVWSAKWQKNSIRVAKLDGRKGKEKKRKKNHKK